MNEKKILSTNGIKKKTLNRIALGAINNQKARFCVPFRRFFFPNVISVANLGPPFQNDPDKGFPTIIWTDTSRNLIRQIVPLP